MAKAFQSSAFQLDAFQCETIITSLRKIRLPVDYYLVDAPQFTERYRTVEGNVSISTKSVHRRGPSGRLSQNPSSFTTTTNKRGYD